MRAIALLALGLLGGCVPVFHITEGGKFTTDPISIPSGPMEIRAKCFGAAGCVTYQAPIGESAGIGEVVDIEEVATRYSPFPTP